MILNEFVDFCKKNKEARFLWARNVAILRRRRRFLTETDDAARGEKTGGKRRPPAAGTRGQKKAKLRHGPRGGQKNRPQAGERRRRPQTAGERNDRRRARASGRRRHGQSARASGRTCSAKTNRPQMRADLFGKDQRRARTGSGYSVPYVSAVTRSMTCGVSGRSRMSVGTDAISSTTSIPSMTLPKAAYWPSR